MAQAIPERQAPIQNKSRKSFQHVFKARPEEAFSGAEQSGRRTIHTLEAHSKDVPSREMQDQWTLVYPTEMSVRSMKNPLCAIEKNKFPRLDK
jgi:hypothetical protein